MKDIDVYNRYAAHSSCPVNCWWAQFPYFWGYSLTGKRKSLWAVVDDLFVPFLYSGKYLSLLTMPFGEGTPAAYTDVLKKCLSLCSRHNRTHQVSTHIRWITEDHVHFLQQDERFSELFHVRELTIGPEYLYGIQSLNSLEGKEFTAVRYKRNKFNKEYPDVILREYVPSDYTRAVDLHIKWSEDAQNRYSNIFDSAYFPDLLKNNDIFKYSIFVAVHEDRIVGLVAGTVAPRNHSFCFIRKALYEYQGLTDVLLLRLVQEIHAQNSQVELLNDGGTGLKPGMMRFKERYRPKLLLNRYRLEFQSLNILRQNTYKGPSITGFSPSVRLVVEDSRQGLENELSGTARKRIHSLLSRTFGTDANNMDWQLEQTPVRVVAQVAILIQQAARHPVKQYGIRQLSPDKIEIHFEVFRQSIADSLVECLQAFWRSGVLGINERLFIDIYQSHRRTMGFTLNEYIIWDRMRSANRLGVGVRPDKGFRAWLGRGSAGRFVSLGYTQNTPRLAKKIAGDKSLSFTFLQRKGLPVPDQKTARSADTAIRAARQVGFPVVLKPRQGNKGKGVAVNLTTPEAVAQAYKEAAKFDSNVVVERFVAGDDFRLLVINGRFIAAVRRIPAHVTGDGRHTVKELMERTNRRERRDGLFLEPLTDNSATRNILNEQGLHLESVPEKNNRVWLRRAANVSLGGTIEDVTDQVHPDNRAVAVSAAAACLLDVAGVDFKSPDLSRSWKNGLGKIIEINAGPGIELHIEPTRGTPREISQHIVRTHFPPRDRCHQPYVAIAGMYGKESVARHCAAIWSRMGISPGLLLKDGLVIDGKEIPAGSRLFDRVSNLERHTEYDAAACTFSAAELLKEGTCTDSFTCSVLTDDVVSAKLLERSHDPDLSARMYMMLADLAAHGTIIDGSSRALRRAVRHLPPGNIVMVWPEPYKTMPPELTEHVEKGGRSLGLRILDRGVVRLTWNDGNTSSEIASAPLRQTDKFKSFLLAVAAVIVANASLDKLSTVLDGYDDFIAAPPVNSLVRVRCPERKNYSGCASPYDRDAREAFLQECGSAENIFFIASARPGMQSEWKKWSSRLATKQIHYLLEAEHAGAGPESLQKQVFSSLEEAWKQAFSFAGANDAVLLLTQEYERRNRFMTFCRQQASLPRHREKEKLWPAELLAELFQGGWINGPAYGWGVDRIGWGESMAGPGILTILPGPYPEKISEADQKAAGLEKVFRLGARAAATSVMSNMLARWKPVLLTDDPYSGALRLARYARSRFRGLVISLATVNERLLSSAEQIRSHLTGLPDSGIWFDRELFNNEHIDHLTAVILALANTQPEHPYTLIPWDMAEPFAGRLLSPDLVVLDGRCPDAMPALRRMIANVPEHSVIVVLGKPENDCMQQKPAAENQRQIEFIAASATGSEDDGWREAAAVIAEQAGRLRQRREISETPYTVDNTVHNNAQN